MRIPAAPLLNPLELLDDPQLVARQFFQPLASTPPALVPGPPFRTSHHQPKRSGWRPGDIESGPLAGLRVSRPGPGLGGPTVWSDPAGTRRRGGVGRGAMASRAEADTPIDDRGDTAVPQRRSRRAAVEPQHPLRQVLVGQTIAPRSTCRHRPAKTSSPGSCQISTC